MTWLRVPFAEKDEAKRLGARWNPTARSWFVPAGVDPSPFRRWLPSEEPDPSGTQGLRMALDAPGPRVTVTIGGLRCRCWKCGRPTVSVVGLFSEHAEGPWDLLETLNDNLIRQVAAELLDEPRRRAAQVGLIKRRYSKTVGHAYLSNGCYWCDALQGDFPLSEDLAPVLTNEGLAGLEQVATVQIPTSMWEGLVGTPGD